MTSINKSERMASNSDLLRTYIVVAECKNVTHAASALNKTQSAVSSQIKKLEEVLNVSLFQRSSRGMTLTAEGEDLLPAARRVITELRQIGSLFDDPLRGRLRLGIPDDYTESVLENALVRFSERHPNVEVSAQLGCTSKFPEAIYKGLLDVAVVSDTKISQQNRIKTEPNVWAAGLSYSVNTKQVVPVAILNREQCSWNSFGTDALAKAGIAWRIAYASESFAGVKAAIRSGLAVGVIPESLLEPEMKKLTKADGFPELLSTKRGILVSENAPKNTTQAMIEAIHAATSTYGQLNG